MRYSHGKGLRKGHGQDARATVTGSGQIVTMRKGAYLPHWTRRGAIYSITFRLHDSLPQEALQRLRLEAQSAWRTRGRNDAESDEDESRSLAECESRKVEGWLDRGHGVCVLRDNRAARIVSDALAHFDGERYVMFVWCVMPNHVHTMIRPLDGYELPDTLHSWKSYTATMINRALGRCGELWQPEYYDRLIRDEDEFQRHARYILNNPSKAGLEDWRWVGVGGGLQRGDEPLIDPQHSPI
jgi:REP element-mobilizing transposase RayT